MIKYVVLLAGVTLAVAQRSPYAGPITISRPQILPQYLSTTGKAGIIERFGDENNATTTVRNYEAYNPYKDPTVLKYMAKLPVDKQPFWYRNREVIENQLANRGINRLRQNGATQQADTSTGVVRNS